MTMNLPCAVVRDLLPLYAEKMTEPETQKLMDEHLETCPDCRSRLSQIEVGTDAAVDTAKPLKALKKEIQKRRWFTALIASLCVLIAVYTYFYHENEMRLIPWEDGLIEVKGIETRPGEEVFTEQELLEQNESAVDVLVIRADSRITGYQESVFQDDGGMRTVILQAWSADLRSLDTDREYTEQVYYPVPDRLIYCDESQHQLLWGEPMNGGVEVLPRLALAYYLCAAVLLAAVFGLVWFFLRNRDYRWIPRQLFFAPASYVLAHVLIKGVHTASFFLVRDFISILLITIALYALVSLLWQVWLQRKKAA